MAKYTIHHYCGHEETVELFGPNKERQNKIAWLESQPCVQCRLAGTEDLKGSPKQRAWAGEIRQSKLAGLSTEDTEILMGIKSARWWIDNRDQSGQSLVNDIKLRREVDQRAENVDESKLSPLTGTDDEIKRAKKIRRTIIAAVERLGDLNAGDGSDEALNKQRDEAVGAVVEWIDSHKEAKWFILNLKDNEYNAWRAINGADDARAKQVE